MFKDAHWRLYGPWKKYWDQDKLEVGYCFQHIFDGKFISLNFSNTMAVVPRGVILGMLFYLTFAVAGTIWISMKYLSENDCNCAQYYERLKSPTSQHEHDFPHTVNQDTIASKQKRADGTSVQDTEKGTVN